MEDHTETIDGQDRQQLREDFARMLTWGLKQHGITHRDLAERLGWKNHTRIYAWLNGRVEPAPHQVFAIERAIPVPPGTLSRTLGYLPPEARSATGPTVSFDEAIDAHPYLPPVWKEIIHDMVKRLTPKEPHRPRAKHSG